MGDALTSFLQSEINNIAGSALKSVDISFGMETYDVMATPEVVPADYSFRFAKRFYNDRIRVVLGGRISTGENIDNGQAQPFIDNAIRRISVRQRWLPLRQTFPRQELREPAGRRDHGDRSRYRAPQENDASQGELFNFKKTKVKPVKEETEKE